MIKLKHLPISYQTSYCCVGADPERGIIFVVHYDGAGHSYFQTGCTVEQVEEMIRSDIAEGDITDWFNGEELYITSCDNCGENTELFEHVGGDKFCADCITENNIVQCPHCKKYDDDECFYWMGPLKVCSQCQEDYHGRSEYPWGGP